MSSREFLVLLPPRLGGLDLIIPMLFDWAAKPGGFHRIHFIFPSNNLFHNLNQNPVLMNQICHELIKLHAFFQDF